MADEKFTALTVTRLVHGGYLVLAPMERGGQTMNTPLFAGPLESCLAHVRRELIDAPPPAPRVLPDTDGAA